jgi:hypothetical protein
LLLRQDGLVILLRPLVIRLLNNGVQRVEVRIAGGHGLPWSRRDDARCHDALLLRQRVVLGRHVLLLAHQTIEALYVVRAQLVRLEVAVHRLGVRRAARHVLQLNMIGIEVLNDSDVVALPAGHRHIAIVHHHVVLHVGLHVGRHLRSVEASRAGLLVVEAVQVLAGRAALADRANLVLVLPHGLELLVLGVVNAVVEGF